MQGNNGIKNIATYNVRINVAQMHNNNRIRYIENNNLWRDDS